jgi:hypothetical protein
LLPACAWLFWSVLPTPEVESLELEEVDELADELADDGVVVEVELVPDVDPEFVEVVVLVPGVASAVSATPETKATVRAPAAAAAAVPAMAARVRRVRPFMATTIAGRGSGRSHNRVKASSRLDGSRVRARGGPA